MVLRVMIPAISPILAKHRKNEGSAYPISKASNRITISNWFCIGYEGARAK